MRLRLKRRSGSTVETKWSDLCGIWMTDLPALRRHRGAAVKIARQPRTPARVSRREMRIFSYKSFRACDGIVIRGNLLNHEETYRGSCRADFTSTGSRG